MAAEEGKTPVSAEQLAEAEEKYKKALELRDKDVESAIQLLGEVLEIRNNAYGEKALECADVYLYYGQLLFEQAQANTDYLGEQMKSAAMERAKHILSADGEGGAGGSGDEAAADDEAQDTEPDGAEVNQQPDDAAEAQKATSSAKAPDSTPAAEATTQAAADPAGVQAAEPAVQEPPSTTTPTDQQAATTGDAGGTSDAPAAEVPEEAAAAGDKQEDEQAAEEEGGDDGEEGAEGSDDEDLESDAEPAEGEDAEEGAQITGENDDMALAWEMLEMARLIYTGNDGAAAHASKLADCYMYIGDILAEQEKFEEAVKEYNTALEMLEKVEGGLSAVKRRAAEVEFKRSTALQLSEQPKEALAAIRSAKAHLQARLNELNSQLANKAGGTSSTAADAAGAAAFAAFASVLTSYKPGDSADAKDTTNTAEEAAADARLQQEIADLRSVIESMNDRIDELSAAVNAHEDMKETIKKAFAMASAGQGGPGDKAGADGAGSSGAAAAAAAGPVETIGFGPAPANAGPVSDMGVIGKGKRVAPVPVATSDAAPSAAAADGTDAAEPEAAEGNKKRPLSDVYNTDQQSAADKQPQESSGSKGDCKVQAAVEQGGAKKVKA